MSHAAEPGKEKIKCTHNTRSNIAELSSARSPSRARSDKMKHGFASRSSTLRWPMNRAQKGSDDGSMFADKGVDKENRGMKPSSESIAIHIPSTEGNLPKAKLGCNISESSSCVGLGAGRAAGLFLDCELELEDSGTRPLDLSVVTASRGRAISRQMLMQAHRSGRTAGWYNAEYCEEERIGQVCTFLHVINPLCILACKTKIFRLNRNPSVT